MAAAGVKNILIINLGGMGDLLLSTPALRALRELYPDSFISALVTQAGYEIAKGLSYLNDVRIFYMDSGGKISFTKIPENLRTLLLLRKRRFDLAVNMRTLVSKTGAFKIKLLLNMINPRIMAGRNTGGRGSFFDIKIAEAYTGEKYEMDYDIETVEALGAKVSDRKIDFEVGEEAANKVKQMLEEHRIYPGGVLLGIHLGGRPSRRWPVENFSELIKNVSAKIRCRFVITGEYRDSGLRDKLTKMAGIETINMTGRLNIKELGALIKICSVYISNDTGPMHMAAVLKTPLVAIFGPGCFVRFDPRNISDKTFILYKKADCAPCDRITCCSMKCLKSISPQEVAEAAFSLLNQEGNKLDA